MAKILQAYQAAIAFLDTVYFREYSNDLGSLLGDMQLLKHLSNWQANPCTMDDIMWNNWILAATKISKKTVTISDTLHEDQSFKILKEFLLLYIATVASVELITIYKKLENTNSAICKLWHICFQKAQADLLDCTNDSLISQNTNVTQDQAISIMYHFTQEMLPIEMMFLSAIKKLQAHTNDKNLDLNLFVMQSLKDAYLKVGKNLNKNITVLDLFKIWVEFITIFTTQLQVQHNLDITNKYSYFDTGQPTDYMIYYYWLRSFHKTLYPGTIE